MKKILLTFFVIAMFGSMTMAQANKDRLYKIGPETSNEDYLNLALQGYIHSINTGTYPDAQKLLMLRKAMDIAKTTLQKQTILKEAGNSGTFPALVFAGNYLDDTSLQQEASHAVMNIVLSDKKYYGKVVRDLLNKTITVLKGTDSGYQKEAIRKYLAEMPADEGFALSDEEKKAGFKVLFDCTNMAHWTGDTAIFVIEDGDMVTRPKQGNLYGNLFTKDEYSDFDFRFDFQLTPGANSGVGIRAPLEGNAAYLGMELQIIDNGADVFKNLKPYQYHGSIYGVIPAKRGYLKPVGEWNYQEVIAKGPKIKVILNGTVIVDADISEASENGTMDHLKHPGLKRTSGHIGFLGHASIVRFKNIRVKDLSK